MTDRRHTLSDCIRLNGLCPGELKWNTQID